MISNRGALISYAQNVNNNGSSLYLNNAVSTALSYVNDDVENMYRIIVLTTSGVSFGYDLSSYDYTNVSLNIVSLGGGSVGSYLESITHDTGGDVYYGYPSSSLTGASGGSVYIPPQFIAEDSDGDGIPDLVERYGLKPNGELIDSNPYNKHSDSDGLEDNEELHFSKEKMTYELDKSQYDGSVFIWSDPCLDDTDGDGLDDKEEMVVGTSPSLADTDGDRIMDGDDIYPLNPYAFKEYENDKWEDFTTYLCYNKYYSTSVLDRFNYNNAIENSFDFEYIESQYNAPVSSMKYGYEYTMEHNGCELIAIYNALKLKEKYQALSEIALEMEINDGMAMDLNLLRTHPNCPNIPGIFSNMGITLYSGYFGSNPFYIRQYLNAHKYKNEQTDSLSELQSWIKPGRVFILSYWNDKNSIGGGIHTIAAQVNSDGTIRTYNKTSSNHFNDFIDLINCDNGSFIIGYYLC